MNNIILNTDSYKASHWLQYPPGTTKIYSYIESRGGEYDKTVMFGLQMFLQEYLSKPITLDMINEAEEFFNAHGEPFNRAGWEYILEKHKGALPLRIWAVPEGTVIDTKNVLVLVVNTDPECFWLTSYVETALLRAVWYPTTVATQSYYIKQTIKKFLIETADDSALAGLPFKLHDFGARGVSSFESASIGGCAHLVNFMGSDTISGVLAARKYYNESMAAFSVPASEHSSITSWGKTHEADAYRNMMEKFKGYPIISVVSDSYDIMNAVGNIWGDELKKLVVDSGSTLVVRPDSGDPAFIVLNVVRLLDEKFGSTVNSKGYKVLNNVRVLQGDGINKHSITQILTFLKKSQYSTDNVVFGMGGQLLQGINRDTLKFAYKACAGIINGEFVKIFKDPVTDSVKKSKAGIPIVIKANLADEHLDLDTAPKQEYVTVCLEDEYDAIAALETLTTMKEVFVNGYAYNNSSFADVRARANK